MTALLLAILSWNPVPDADSYRVMVNQQDYVIPAGPCPAGCSVQVDWPELAVGEVLYFKLVASREGCESVTAFPPEV